MARRSVGEGVAGAYRGANFGHEHAALFRELQDFAERGLEVFLNVVAKGFEWRDVEYFGAVGQISGQGLRTSESMQIRKRRGSCRSRWGEISVVLPARICGQPCDAARWGYRSGGRTIPGRADEPTRGRSLQVGAARWSLRISNYITIPESLLSADRQVVLLSKRTRIARPSSSDREDGEEWRLDSWN